MPDHLPVVLTSSDFSILETLSQQWGEPFAGAAEMARKKLAAASVVFPADVPDDVVTLNRRVRFRVDNSQAQERKIVCDPSEAMYGLTLLLTSPRGLGMIGSAAGHAVHAPRKDGSWETLYIEEVLFHPERRRTAHDVALFPKARTRVGVPAYSDDDPGPSAA